MDFHQRIQRKTVVGGASPSENRAIQTSRDRASKVSPFQSHGFGVQTKSSASTPVSKAQLWENYQRATKLSQNWSNTAVAGSEQTRSPTQAKLTIGQPGDKYEQEADSVAERVMAMSEPAQVQREELPEEEEELQMKPLAETISPLVQREELPEEEEELQMKPEDNVVQREELPEEEELQMKSVDNSIQREELPEEEEELQMKQSSPSTQTATGDLESQLSSSKGGGSPLSDDVRSFMEPRFGADFSGVRVHTGSDAVQMNQGVNAQAFAHGSDIYFGAGKAPGKDALTAHELTHVVQQAGGVQRKWTVQRFPKPLFPTPADKVAQPAIESGNTSQQQETTSLSAATLQRQSISTLVQRDELPAADGVVEPLTKAEVQTAKAFYLIHKQRYTAAIIKQIQIEVGTEPTSSIDDETIQAVAKFQQANPPLKVDGQAGPRTLPAAFPDGLAKASAIDKYVGEAKQVEADWAKLKTANKRADALLKSVNAQLKAANVPICNKVVKDLGPAAGQLDFATWTLELGQQAFSQPAVTKEQAAEIADTVYHEARHAEQWYRMAQFLAGKKKTAKQIATEMGIPANIAKEAHDRPLQAGSMEAVIAEGWYESVYGAKADYRAQVLTDVMAKATAAKKAQAQFDKSPTDANQKKLDLATEKFHKAHQKYTDLPEEADAWRVGGAVENAYKK